jgi:hypothetical protein
MYSYQLRQCLKTAGPNNRETVFQRFHPNYDACTRNQDPESQRDSRHWLGAHNQTPMSTTTVDQATGADSCRSVSAAGRWKPEVTRSRCIQCTSRYSPSYREGWLITKPYSIDAAPGTHMHVPYCIIRADVFVLMYPSEQAVFVQFW